MAGFISGGEHFVATFNDADPVRELADRVKAMTEEERSRFLSLCRETFCTECGSQKSDGRCWGCYVSPRDF